MKEKKEEGRWLSEEPNGWLGGILFMSVYCGAFFGFNAARTFMDGHAAVGCVLLSGALVSAAVFRSACVEVVRRWRER